MEEISYRKKKRKTTQEKSLNRAFATITSVIENMATGIKKDMESGKKCDVKQIKELTGAAKELAALLGTLSCSQNTPYENEKRITVVFESEGEQWGK